MNIIEIDSRGEARARESNKRTLAAEFDVHVRDLRPVFSLRQVATILRRGEAIIVNFKSVKLVVGNDRVLVFNLENPKIVEQFVPMLSEKIQKREETPFELSALDTAFLYIVQKTRSRFEELLGMAGGILERLERNPNDGDLTQLLHVKKRISQLESRAQEVEDLFGEILEEDEDIAALCLQDPEGGMEEAESILEDNLEQVENINHQIDELNENIDDTQEIITLKLARVRNDIIRFDLIVSVVTSILGLLAVVVGLYGVNLKNHLEESPRAFGVLALSLLIVFGMSWIGVRRYMREKKLL